jgi:diguanylate cyclase (GGDEF)-like protein
MEIITAIVSRLGIREEFEKGLLARILIMLDLVLVIFGAVFVAIRLLMTLLPAFPDAHWTDLLIESLILLIGLAALYCIRQGRMRAAARLILLSILLAVTLQTYFLGGPANDISGAMGMMFFVFLAVLLLDRADRLIALILVVLIFTGLNILSASGAILPVVHLSPVGKTLFATFVWLSISVITAYILAAAMGAMRREPYLLEQTFKGETYPGQNVPFLSTHDALTGLYNRLFFEAEFGRLEKSRLFPITVLTAEITGLKSYNEQHGYKAGDERVIAAARLLAKAFRPEDIICRYGGDQFAVLLPQVDAATAKVILARIHEQLSAYNGKHPARPLSLAIGLSTARQGDSLKEHMKNAERKILDNNIH